MPPTQPRTGTRVSDRAIFEKDLPRNGASGMAGARRAHPAARPEGARMGIADQLNAMRGDFAGCRLATFADLSSGLVLFTSAEGRVRQERLDALCERARTLVVGNPAEAGASVLKAPVLQAVASDADGLLVVVRVSDEPDEALICHCDPDIDLLSFTARAASELAALAAAS